MYIKLNLTVVISVVIECVGITCKVRRRIVVFVVVFFIAGIGKE